MRNMATLLRENFLQLKRKVFYRRKMRKMDFHGLNFRDADISYMDMSYADLHGADMSYADISHVNLHGADLRGAIMVGTSLWDADLTGADLRGICVRKTGIYTNLIDVKIDNNTKMPDIPMECPETGAFIGYKKAHGYIVVLEIPADAKRSSAMTVKCRCDKAKVIAIQNIDGTDAYVDQVPADYDRGFVYKVGEIVSVSDFDECRWCDITRGIHFFMTRETAAKY